MSQRGALFGSSATRSQNKNLVEFKAGKMTMKGKMVHPDKRKGLVYVYQSEDSLMHFCWKDRITGTVEDDLIIFPDDCEFKRVSQCTTGRVYILKFKSSNRKFFFWVQEPRADKDEENCRKINEVLNNPPTPGSQRSGGATPDENLQNLLQNMSQQQLMQLFGGVSQMNGLSSLLGSISGRPPAGQNTASRAATSASGAATSSGGATAASTATTPKPATTTSQPSPPQAKPTSSTDDVGSEEGAGVSGADAGVPDEEPQWEGLASQLQSYKDKTERALEDQEDLKARYKALRITFRQELVRYNAKKREVEDWVPDGEYCGQMVTGTPDLPDDLSPSEPEDDEPHSSSFSELPDDAPEKEKEKNTEEKPMHNEIFYITTVAKNVNLRLKIDKLRERISAMMNEYEQMTQDMDLVPPIVDAEVHELFKNMPKSPKSEGSDTEN